MILSVRLNVFIYISRHALSNNVNVSLRNILGNNFVTTNNAREIANSPAHALYIY